MSKRFLLKASKVAVTSFDVPLLQHQLRQLLALQQSQHPLHGLKAILSPQKGVIPIF